MNALRRITAQLAGTLQLPEDVVLDLPKVTLVGGIQVFIENHKGILEYSPRRIRVLTTQGELAVVGTRLRISTIFKEEVVISGRIYSLEYLK